MGDWKDWDEVKRVLQDGSVYEADMETLKRYLRAVTDPPPSRDDALFHAQLYQAGETIRQLISQKETKKQLRVSIRWGKVAAWAAIIGVIVMLVQLYLYISSGR